MSFLWSSKFDGSFVALQLYYNGNDKKVFLLNSCNRVEKKKVKRHEKETTKRESDGVHQVLDVANEIKTFQGFAIC